MPEKIVVTPEEAEREIARLKAGLVAHLESAAAGAQVLGGPRGRDLIITDADGNPVRVSVALVEDGRLFVRGYVVEDPEDQAVDGEETELSAEALAALGLEDMLAVVRHFAG